MMYIKVKWIHALSDEPVLLYSELDGDHWEVRKIEIFADERMGYASSSVSVGSTRLGEEPLPSLQQIASDPQFEPAAITQSEFDAIWAEATAR